MTKKLLTKTCALMLLAVFAAAWSSNAWALTINVKASQEPYVYAWDNNQNPLLGAFPGTKLTNTKSVGGQTWYYIDIDATNVNLILSFGTDATKTGDITGITGNRYFEFANNNANNVTDYYDAPNGVGYQSNPFTYVVNASNWSGDVYAYAWGNGYSGDASSWPGKKMTKVGTNGNGNDVYEWISDSQTNPANVIFNNNSGSQTSDLTWANGAYWSNYGNDSRMTISGAILNSTNFPDANLRKAITASTGIQEGGAITANNVKVLDISYDTDKGMTGKITNPTGIEQFTYLEELYSQNNSLSHLDLTHTSSLRILDVSGDNELLGMRGVSYCNASGHGVNVKGNNNFKKLIADNCPAWIYNAGLGSNNTNYQYISSVEYISMRNNPLDGWSSGFTAQANLKYLDLTNSGQKTSELTAANLNFPSLETLILANNTSVTTPVLTNLTSLKTLDVKNCAISSLDITHNTSLEYLYASGNATDPAMTIPNTNSLKWIDMSDGNLSYITAFNKLSNLQHLDLHNCPHLSAAQFNSSRINSTANPNLQYLNISQSGNSASSKITTFTDDWAYIDTLIVQGGNSPVEKVIVNNHMPNVLDVTNNTTLTTLAINNCGLSSLPTITATGATSLYKLDLSDNAFTDVPTTGISSLTTMVMNNNQLSDINVSESNINYLYAQNNNFQAGDYTLPLTSLVGLDLGYNGFTKFKAENNTSLKSLALAGNTDLTEIELHGNTALTQTSPDGVIESDNGLYIKGLSSLQTLNIENSSFNKLGQQNSLEGVTGLKKLQARHNEFTTFTNGVYNLDISGHANYRVADPNESSLEYLENLEYLDLAYNNLQDSVHLYRNVALKHLDVSHNNEIHGVIDGTIDVNDAAAVEAMKVKKGYNYMKYGRVYGKDPNTPNAKPMPGWNPSAQEWTTGYTNLQALRERPFDLRIEDLNDTTGLYHLDLGKNVNLEWLDISYTNIHNTSAGPTHMNPGWMDTDWVTDMGTFAGKPSQNTTTHRAYVSWHTFVYFIPCTKLQVLHADHNNMRSLGVRYFPDLDTLTCSYMYGDSEIMRDFSGSGDLRYGMGNTGTQTSIKKFQSVDWDNLDSDGYPTIVLVGPNGTTANSDIFPNKLRYWDLSYSGYNEVRLYPGSAPDLPYLEYIDVSGNPLNFTNHASNANYANVSNWNSLDVTYCPNIKTVKADNCSDLPVVRAHNRGALTTLDLTNDPKLKTVYVQNDASLPSITGLSTLTGLKTLFAYNNTQWGGINVSSNTALKNLWVSNINASSIDVSHNTALEKLRVYDNSLTALNVASNPALTWLDFARNSIEDINLSANTALQYFNCSNSEETLNDQSLAANNHNGGEADDVKPVTVDNKVGSNSLSDLVFPGTAIADVRANFNDLHCIKTSTNDGFANLTNIEFAHNHINGIDLSAATGSPTINSADNGREIVADCAKFYKKVNNVPQEFTVYFFQLDPTYGNPENQNHNGTVLTMKTSEDTKGATRYLGTDGLVMDNITWDGTSGGMLRNTITPGTGGGMDLLDPDDVPGTIVVLNPTSESGNGANGKATYSYANGKGNSEFYLDWSSDGTITGINQVEIVDGISIANSYGDLTLAGKDGTIVGVYDLNGRQVASETITDGKAVITGLTPGIYVVNGVKVLVK
ncbi:MAG: starch-binding protein [Muribaculaceae bacterium]|nr:starch-binding protein [Muribaculaceae bacterium]